MKLPRNFDVNEYLEFTDEIVELNQEAFFDYCAGEKHPKDALDDESYKEKFVRHLLNKNNYEVW